MWDRESFQAGIDALAAAGSCEVVIIPFFVSSHSTVIRAQLYQFGLTGENPLPFDPGRVSIPTSVQRIRFRPALDNHRVLSEILRDRARELSFHSAREEVIFVAHGPVDDDDDKKWKADLGEHIQRICQNSPENLPCLMHPFTLQDDAPKKVRDQRTQELRGLIGEIERRGNSPLVVPVLLARGGIEGGLLTRLEGLRFRYSGHMLAPDSRLVEWLVEQARD
jgi:hypothetical protein